MACRIVLALVATSMFAQAPIAVGGDRTAGLFPGISRYFRWYDGTPSGGCVNGAIGYCVGHDPVGDTYFPSAWLPNASQLPVTGGLPVVGTINDGHFNNACSGASFNIAVVQFDTWSWATPNASHITAINCMTSFGTGAAKDTPVGWNGVLTSADGQTLGTWKSRTPFSRGGIIYLPVERQFSPGDPSVHDATIIQSPDGGKHWCNPYTLFNVGSNPGVCDSSKWQATGDAPVCGAASNAVPCANAGYTDATHSSIMWKGFPYGTENWYWVNYGYQDGGTAPVTTDGTDPSTYDYFMSYDGSLARVAKSDILQDISKWQYYTCPSISQSLRCSPGVSGNWTSTFASRTGTFYLSYYLGPFEESFTQLFGSIYLPEFKAYIRTGVIQPSPDAFDIQWSPSLTGPWTLVSRNSVQSTMWGSFFSPSPALGYTVVGISPPHVKLTTTSNDYATSPPEGSVQFHEWDLVLGQQQTGATPRAQNLPMYTTGAGFKFSPGGNVAGTLPSSGLVWSFDFLDQGITSGLTNWPYFQDRANQNAVMVPCDGTSYTTVSICGTMNSGHGTTMNNFGPVVTDTNFQYFGHLRSFTGEGFWAQRNAPSAMAGNGTYSVVNVVRYDGGAPSGKYSGIWSTGSSSGTANTAVQLAVFSSGAAILIWNADSQPAYAYGPTFTFTSTNWYFVVTTVTAATGGNCPAVSVWVGQSGTITDTNAGHTCVQEFSASTKTPAVTASPLVLGLSVDGYAMPASHATTMIYDRVLSSVDVQRMYGVMKTQMAARGVTLQ